MYKYIVVQNVFSQTVGKEDRVINKSFVLWSGYTITEARKWCMKHGSENTSLWVLHPTARADKNGHQIILVEGGIWKSHSLKHGKIGKDWFWHKDNGIPRAIRSDGTLYSEAESKRKLGTYHY